MGRRAAALMTLVVATLLVALAPAASSAGPSITPPPIFYQAPIPLTAPPGWSDGDQPIVAMIDLGEPAALAAPNREAVVARSRRIADMQAALQPQLAALGAQVLFQASLAYNGIAVSVRAAQIDKLRALPGVVGVRAVPPKQRSNAAAVPFVGAPAVWSASGGLTGRGMRVGVVDSGVDYTHADFGGPGTPAAYSGNNRAIVEPGTFPTAKVVGGYDFAGDAYDATSSNPANRIPHPDPDPLDCNGHGTHIASTLAGFGVNADGTTYRGPYTSGLDFSHFSIGPGVAPEAQLYALKVFGCSGSTELLTLAIERAVDPNGDGDPSDHLDVLNISLGSPFGSDDDPDAVAVDNAVRAGVVVVTAAGDTGNTFYATDSPASAQLAIAVGASYDTARATPPLTPTDSLWEWSARGPQRGNGAIKPDLVAPGVRLKSADFGTGTGAFEMTGTSTATPQVAGAATLLRQLHPSWKPELVKAALINTAAPTRMASGALYPPSLTGAGRLDMTRLAALDLVAYVDDSRDTIALMYGAPWISRTTTLARPLRLANHSEGTRVVTLSATTVVTEAGVTVEFPHAPITLPPRGTLTIPISVTVDPAALDFSPDAATPPMQDNFPRYFLAEHGGYIEVHSGGDGVRVRPAHAADFGDADFYLDDQLLDDSIDSREVQEYSDTTPGVHEVLLRRPGAPPTSPPVFAALTPPLLDGHDYTLIVVGRAGALGLVVVDETPPAPPPAGQSLMHFVNANRVEADWNVGPIDVYLDGVLRAAALPVGQTSEGFIAVAPGTHTVWFFQAGRDPAHDRALTRKTFTVGVGELLLVGTGRHDDDDDDLGDFEQRAIIGRDLPRSSLALRVPFEIFPKSAADAHAVAAAITVPPGAPTFTLQLQNTGARNGGLADPLARARTPLASAFELAATSPVASGIAESSRAADLRYVGVTNNFSVAHTITDTTIFFGFATYDPWSTPNEVQFWTFIDTNMDGVDDYVLINSNFGEVSAPHRKPDDVFLSPLYKIMPDGTLQATFIYFWNTFLAPTAPTNLDVAPFNTSVMFQAASAQFIGLRPGQTRFHYHVETRARDEARFTRVVDRVPALGSPPLVYDIAAPTMAPINLTTPFFALRPVFLDVDGGKITAIVNQPVLAVSGDHLLILHHHNLPAQQAEVVDVRSSTPVSWGTPSVSHVFLALVGGAR
jgi:subtilisin family serine protease